MKIRAAVLEEFGAPLVVQEVDLAGPRAGEVLVRLHACGVCHTDMYTASGVDPSGYAPTVLGHEGAGVVEAIGEGVSSSLAVGDHVVTLFSPAVPRVRPLPVGEDEHLPEHPRRAGQRAISPTAPRGSRVDGEPIRHFMGTSTFAEATVMPEIALAKIDPEAPLDRACLFACGLSTGLGAAMNTAKVEAGSTSASSSARAWSAWARSPGRGSRAPSGSSASTCPRTGWSWPRGRGRPTRSSVDDDAVAQILEMTDGFGADYTFEATGNVKVMAQAVEAARMGWGLCTVTGVAGKGETLDVIPRFLITGRRIAGSSFGGVKGRDQVPEFVNRYMAGDIDVDAFLSHSITLDEVNKGFDLMHAQDGIRSVINPLT